MLSRFSRIARSHNYLSWGDNMRRMARRELGVSIAKRWFC
jgi:hypothetical protein